MTSRIGLAAILDLERIETDRFRGNTHSPGWQRVFGGQVVAQGLMAASLTVDRRPAHSLHAYFLRPGDPALPILYEVDRIRDGRSFTTRRVVAIQNGEAIFSMAASFHADEPGFAHQAEMPKVAAPEELMSETDMRERFGAIAPPAIRRYWERQRPIEIRPVSLKRYIGRAALAPQQLVWFRVTEPLPEDPAFHRCALAYASDLLALDTSLYPHGVHVFDSQMQVASLDHAMWFHRPFRADDWLLYALDSPAAAGARGFNRGSLFTRAGDLVASVAQEGLIREHASEKDR